MAVTRRHRAARGADAGRGPIRTWQQVGEAAHGALQLCGGGRVPPHVLLVALAQLPQPLHRAAGRGRRCRHAPARPRASGRRRTAHARPAPLCAADGRRGGGLKARRRRHGRCGARRAAAGWALWPGRGAPADGGVGGRRPACQPLEGSHGRVPVAAGIGKAVPTRAVPAERFGSPVFGHLSAACFWRRQQSVLQRVGTAVSGCCGAYERCPGVCTARTGAPQPRVPFLIRVPALVEPGDVLRASPQPRGAALRDPRDCGHAVGFV